MTTCSSMVIATLGAVSLLGPSGLQAQDEARLRRALEGRRVTVLIDMPASSEGVDLFPGTGRPLDFQKYSGRLKKSGTSIKEGERSIITKVRAKDEIIEIHLGGGGYGTFGDELGSLATNNGADSGSAQQARIANERTQRLSAGSRFNLRYPNGVTPEDLEADRLVEVLAEYLAVSAPPGGLAAPVASAGITRAEQRVPDPEGTAGPQAHKGMSVEEVERSWGKPSSMVENGSVQTRAYTAKAGNEIEVDFYNGVAVEVRKRASLGVGTVRKGMTLSEVEAVAGRAVDSKPNGGVTTNRYRWQEGILEADFYNGVLVAYRITSN